MIFIWYNWLLIHQWPEDIQSNICSVTYCRQTNVYCSCPLFLRLCIFGGQFRCNSRFHVHYMIPYNQSIVKVYFAMYMCIIIAGYNVLLIRELVPRKWRYTLYHHLAEETILILLTCYIRTHNMKTHCMFFGFYYIPVHVTAIILIDTEKYLNVAFC